MGQCVEPLPAPVGSGSLAASIDRRAIREQSPYTRGVTRDAASRFNSQGRFAHACVGRSAGPGHMMARRARLRALPRSQRTEDFAAGDHPEAPQLE